MDMHGRNPVYVIGHKNPDTDASASAVAYAEFLNLTQRYSGQAVPVVAGCLLPQAQFVFDHAGIAVPQRVASLAPKVIDVCNTAVDFLGNRERLGVAIDRLIRSGHSMLPIINNDGRLCGVFSNREDISRILMRFDVVPLTSSLLRWEDVFELPGTVVHGQLPPDSECGTLYLAMEGDSSWRELITRDDILIGVSTNILRELPLERWPARFVLASDKQPSKKTLPDDITNRICVLHFSGGVSDLLRLLSLQVRLECLEFGIGPCLGDNDLLEDVRGLIEENRRALPVVSDSGKLVGVIARSDLQKKTSRRAILIDHFEAQQAVPGIEHLEILEIIDHHRIGDIQTASPIRVDCRPIGSSCTIVALNYFEAGLIPSPGIATLMLGGLCSDTLALTSPTTTAVDHKIASRLAEIAGLELTSFASQLFKAGDDLRTADPRKIWNRDQKFFSIRNHRFAVAQLETVSVDDLSKELLETLRDELHRDFRASGCLCSLLVLTDVIRSCSLIASFELPAVAHSTERAFQTEANESGWMLVPGLVSRKKQIIPALMGVLAELKSLES